MSWTETETIAAVKSVSQLSELLALDEFEPESLRYLTDQHINKFLKAIDEEDATKIFRLTSESNHETKRSLSGFRILDWLRVTGGSEHRRKTLEASSEPGHGTELIIRLAKFQPEWIGRWWRWRCATGRDVKITLRPVEECVVEIFEQSDFETYLPIFSAADIAAIVGRKPQFAEFVPLARCASVACFALDQDQKTPGLVESLSGKISFDAIRIVDLIIAFKEDRRFYFGNEKKEDPLSRLDELVDRWRGPTDTNPVALAMIAGHKPLELLLRSRLNVTVPQSINVKDDELWKDNLGYYAGGALASGIHAVPHIFKLELGFILGVRLANGGIEPSYDTIGSTLESLHIKHSHEMLELFVPIARLWSTLRMLAKYQRDPWKHDAELTGLRVRTVTLATETPDLWAQSLIWILSRLSAIGDVAEAVTIQLSISNSQVRNALEEACTHSLETIRLKAQGLRSLVYGMEGPETGLARALADAAARYLDGRPIFPHPLTPVAATWLGALGLEQAISNGVRRALVHFSEEVREQGGNIEEALTEGLVKELEFEFRALQPRLKLLGPAQSSNPILTVRQRPTSKKLEEPEYGCDLAWVLNANVSGQYKSAWADLVQVKKSTALYKRDGPAHTDAWIIKNDQLDQILKWSATATYWLIAAAGEVLVVPAKHLLALKNGVEKRALAQTFTIGYNDVRSAAIPLEQYLLDLLIGQWIGTTAEDTVKFARGENANIRPRVVLEITISIGSERQ